MKNGPYELITPPKDYPGKRYRGKYAYEHRVNWWRKTGQNPDDIHKTVIHHINENKRDNNLDNIDLVDYIFHNSHHNKKEDRYNDCLNCRIKFKTKRNSLQKFCCRRCIGLYNHRARKLRNTIMVMDQPVKL